MSRNGASRLAWAAMVVWLLASPLAARDINVSLTGDDAGPGTRQQPYRTLQRAQAEARASRRDKPAEPVTVWINQGDWPLEAPLEFTAEDSGTPEARVLYRAVPRAVVRLLGTRAGEKPEKPAVPDPDAKPLVHLNGVSCLMLRGLTIEGGAGHGVLVNGGSENVVAGCKVKNVVGYGVVLQGGSQHAVQSCDIAQAGGGVWLSGGDERAQPRVSAGHRVINNHIREVIPREGVTTAGINCGWPWRGGGERQPLVGVHAAYNLIHDVPRAGVLLGGWDAVFEFNEIFRFGSLSDGPSAAFMGRGSDRPCGGIVIRHNLMHHGHNSHGVELEPTCEADIRGNVVAQIGTGTGYRYQHDPRGSAAPRVHLSNNLAVQCGQGLELPDESLKGVRNNVIVHCPVSWTVPGRDPRKAPAGQQPLVFEHNLAYDAALSFDNLARLDFRLPAASSVFQHLPGFEAIPLDQIGLSLDKYRTELPTEEILHRLTKP